MSLKSKMHKAKLLVDSMCREFSARVNPFTQDQMPFSSILMSPKIGEGSGEGFRCRYHAKKILIEGDSALGAAFGISQIALGIQSGQLAEFLGDSKPAFVLRPLWVKADGVLDLSSDVRLGISSLLMDEPGRDCFCRRVIELGYNAIILGLPFGDALPFASHTSEDLTLAKLCEDIHSFGLKVIVNPTISGKNLCPMDPQDREKIGVWLCHLFKQNSEVDYLIWESAIYCASFGKSQAASVKTKQELLSCEMRVLEEFLPSSVSLIYYIPIDADHLEHQSCWLMSLSDDAGNKTILAFSSLAGDPTLDHLPLHPLWEKLQTSPFILGTPLLPLVNLGGVNQGEGLWPSIPLDLMDRFISRLYRHPFAGMIALTPHLPEQGGILDASLWVGGQMLWRERSSDLLAEIWLRAFHPKEGDKILTFILRKIREIIVALSELKFFLKTKQNISQEECRITAEYLISSLQYTQFQLPVGKIPQYLSLGDYFRYFNQDAKRILRAFLQAYHEKLAKVLSGGDYEESFWTQNLQTQGEGLGIVFCETPSVNFSDAEMTLIFEKNRLKKK